MSDVNDLKAELLVLKAENAELRRERDFYFQQVTDNGERAHRAIDALNAENAKLRELLREILNNCCDGLESTCDTCGCYRKSDGACMADVRAIELGVDL